jgi:hypothetical protein
MWKFTHSYVIYTSPPPFQKRGESLINIRIDAREFDSILYGHKKRDAGRCTELKRKHSEMGVCRVFHVER